MHDDKTELIHVRSRFSHSASCDITIGDSSIKCKPEARNLGVIFNQNLCVKSQINSCCRASYIALSNISKIRKYLNQNQAEKLVHAFVTSRIDHCNSLLYGIAQYDIDKLQRVLNAAARIVKRPKPDESTQDVLRSLHWLPVTNRIIYKILLITFKCRNGLAPNYLSSLLSEYSTGRHLRSSNKGLLSVPRTHHKTYGDRAFAVAAPKLWNTLPIHIKQSDTISNFKTNLKTFLFNKSYSSN